MAKFATASIIAINPNPYQGLKLNRNQGKSIHGDRNQPKSLSGIETGLRDKEATRDFGIAINPNPYQGLKHYRRFVCLHPRRSSDRIAINPNPYQGLKLDEDKMGGFFKACIAINPNPYQGLKQKCLRRYHRLQNRNQPKSLSGIETVNQLTNWMLECASQSTQIPIRD